MLMNFVFGDGRLFIYIAEGKSKERRLFRFLEHQTITMNG